jgi:hypothetical protein
MIYFVVAYALPAMGVWALLGAVFGGLDASITLPLAIAYACSYGLIETLRLPVRTPSLSWQVPAKWILGRPFPTQIAAWGASLGPGLLTRNPYAGIWLLPLLLGLVDGPATGAILGLFVGLGHGVARAVGVVRNARVRASDAAAHLAIMGSMLRWQLIDGLALLAIAGVLLARFV